MLHYAGVGFILLAVASRLALGPTQPPSQWVLGGGSFPGDKAAGVVKLTSHFHLVPRLRMRGYIPPFPNMPSWRGA